ncbi:membrane protein [Photobacterium aquae]|uniref:Membrane protein n=1 Tax=Photobacterium aquae TaxID=1195763 RepID=A0A0J1GW53_9GAMM|nr:rhombosortase [Photobacterium aquae]KLV03933.1 membrane protein [Photobacterium aquae]
MALAQLPFIQPQLVWQSDMIKNGELWRIITGNLTHTNWPHMIMNSMGLAIITFCFRHHLSPKRLFLLLLGLSAWVGCALFAWPTTWYAGLSGVLHGLFAWGALADIKQHDKLGKWLLAAIVAKILWEQFFGGAASSAQLIGARVAVEAHLAGALGGIVFGGLASMAKNKATTPKV